MMLYISVESLYLDQHYLTYFVISFMFFLEKEIVVLEQSASERPKQGDQNERSYISQIDCCLDFMFW